MTRRPRPAETPECRRGRDGGPPRGLSHCAVFGSFEPAPLLRDADFAARCRERACIAHFHGTAFTRRNRLRLAPNCPEWRFDTIFQHVQTAWSQIPESGALRSTSPLHTG